jgi:hypothetical protein
MQALLSPQGIGFKEHLMYIRGRARHRPPTAKSVAELSTSLVKTATLASNKENRRMQYWQDLRA